ncbi:MAG: zeta toxin family protein [Methylobacter sp.]|uniref:zeta toxin family protein n=1 Tax=Methylobacter sp. TaxID=2051955 RepID=UPI00258624E5|nr:zeta toxin family protein [Methylobacter sp.]MCL7422578.1 zeta toxin family protein [Methylobacter sp.]
MRTCWIIAGPNGAGKTTFALEYLPRVVNCSRYINADLIAAGLSPLAPERELMAASRIFLHEIEACIDKGNNFAFETTLAGRTYLKLIDRLRHTGWQVELIYLALPSIKFSKARVAERVAHGGHNIRSKDIERRFARSLHNLLADFSYVVNNCSCFMNIGDEPILIFEQQGEQRNVVHDIFYQHLLKEADL